MFCSARSKQTDIDRFDCEDEREGKTRLAFADFVQFGQERRDAAHVQAVVAPNGFAFAIQQDKGREPFDLILPSQFHVLPFGFNGLRFSARKINLHQNEVLVGVILELRLGKNGSVELKTITAPVRPCEIEKQKLMARFRFVLRFFIIGRPCLIGARAGRVAEGQCDRERYN